MDLSEKQTPNTFTTPTAKSDTLVIDNGTFEIKAGFKGELSLIAKNKIYKNKEKVSLEPFPSATVKSMFDEDVITNFDVLENTIDQVLTHLQPNTIKNLILTSTPNSPTEEDLLDFLFEVYRFDKIQIGTDSVYAYHKYCDKKDCVIVDMKYSSVIVTVIKEGKILETFKISFGGKDLLDYINHVLVDKYKENRKDYRGLVNHIRVADDYCKESIEIYQEMCNGNYRRNLFLTQESQSKIEVVSKKIKKSSSGTVVVPLLDYLLLNASDESLDRDQLKEKRRLKLIFCSTFARIKSKIENLFVELQECINIQKEEHEKLTNFKSYLHKKKNRFYALKRELELRDQLRKNSKNKKTREFQIKHKEGALTEEEIQVRNSIFNAEDEEIENNLISTIDSLAMEIMALDNEFIPYFANTVEILRGDNLGRQCVNIELLKFSEIFFDPSVIGSEQMGLGEIFENIYQIHQIKTVLLAGGFSFIGNLGSRIKNEIQPFLRSGFIEILKVNDSQKDPFYGGQFSDLFPVYDRETYKRK